MSDTTPTPDPDGAIYPDGSVSPNGDSSAPADGPDPASPDARAVGEGGPDVMDPKDAPFWTPSTDPQPNPGAQSPNPTSPDYGRVTNQVDGEMLIANLLVEIANLTRRTLVAETMVQMYQQAAQPKPGQ